MHANTITRAQTRTDEFDTRRAYQNGTTDRPCFCLSAALLASSSTTILVVVLLGGEPRVFPAEELLGAEEILSPDVLGAPPGQALHSRRPRRNPLSKRTFSAPKVANLLAVRRSAGAAKHQLKIDKLLVPRAFGPSSTASTPSGLAGCSPSWAPTRRSWRLRRLEGEPKARLRSHQLADDYWDATTKRPPANHQYEDSALEPGARDEANRPGAKVAVGP